MRSVRTCDWRATPTLPPLHLSDRLGRELAPPSALSSRSPRPQSGRPAVHLLSRPRSGLRWIQSPVSSHLPQQARAAADGADIGARTLRLRIRHRQSSTACRLRCPARVRPGPRAPWANASDSRLVASYSLPASHFQRSCFDGSRVRLLPSVRLACPWKSACRLGRATRGAYTLASPGNLDRPQPMLGRPILSRTQNPDSRWDSGRPDYALDTGHWQAGRSAPWAAAHSVAGIESLRANHRCRDAHRPRSDSVGPSVLRTSPHPSPPSLIARCCRCLEAAARLLAPVLSASRSSLLPGARCVPGPPLSHAACTSAACLPSSPLRDWAPAQALAPALESQSRQRAIGPYPVRSCSSCCCDSPMAAHPDSMSMLTSP